jgi:hypothetical protein
MCLSLTRHLFVADDERDVVLLHVSASSEKQERRNKTGAMTHTTERHILTTAMSVVLLSCSFVQ